MKRPEEQLCKNSALQFHYYSFNPERKQETGRVFVGFIPDQTTKTMFNNPALSNVLYIICTKCVENLLAPIFMSCAYSMHINRLEVAFLGSSSSTEFF